MERIFSFRLRGWAAVTALAAVGLWACASDEADSIEVGGAGVGGTGAGTGGLAGAGGQVSGAGGAAGAAGAGGGSSNWEAKGPWLDDPKPYVRVDLVGSPGSMSIARAKAVVSKPPQPALAGNMLLVSYAGAQLKGATQVSLPTRLFAEGAGPDGARVRAEATLGSSNVSAFLPDEPGVDKIELLDAAGVSLASITGDQIERLRVLSTGDQIVPPRVLNAGDLSERSRVLATGDLSERSRGLFTGNQNDRVLTTPEQLSARYPHIRVLRPADAALVEGGLASQGATIAEPEGPAFDLLAEALDRVQPAPLLAVRNVGLARMPDAGVAPGCYITYGFAFGDSFFLNADVLSDATACQSDREEEARNIAIHETAHNFTYLVDDVAGIPWPNEWPADAQAMAIDVAQRYDLMFGLTSAWRDLHASGVEQLVATSYQGDGWTTMAPSSAPTSGFAHPYGSLDEYEDIATFAEMQEPTPDLPLCPYFAGLSGQRLPALGAVAYAKANMAKGLGLVSDERYQACAGAVSIEGPEGVNLGDGTENQFSEDLKAGALDQDGGHFVAVLGSQPTGARMLLRVRTDETYQALGVHRFDNIGLSNINLPVSGIFIDPPEGDYALTSAAGLALVTQASPERVKGAIFMLSLRDFSGLTVARYPLSTFRVENPGSP